MCKTITILCLVLSTYTVQAKELKAEVQANASAQSLSLKSIDGTLQQLATEGIASVELKDYSVLFNPLKWYSGHRQLVIKQNQKTFKFNIPIRDIKAGHYYLFEPPSTGQSAVLRFQLFKSKEITTRQIKAVICFDPTMPPHASFAGVGLQFEQRDSKIKIPLAIETEVETASWTEYSLYRIYESENAIATLITEIESKSADKIIGSMAACYDGRR